LVFFLLVTSSESQVVSQPKNIALPESIATKTPKQNIVIVVNNNKVELLGKSIAIDVNKLDEKRIGKFINTQLKSRGIDKLEKQKRSVTIMGDKSIPYSVLKSIMLSVAATNVQNISFAVLKKSEG
jgi:biopolymer transport protein ExbD